MKEPITYKLKGMLGEEVKGSFYEQEVQGAKCPDFILIESVLKGKRGENGKVMILVKYLG